MQTTSVFLTTVSTALVTCGSAKSVLIGQVWRNLLLPTMFWRIKHVTPVYKLVEVLHIYWFVFTMSLTFNLFQCNLLIIHFNKWYMKKMMADLFLYYQTSVGLKKRKIKLFWNVPKLFRYSNIPPPLPARKFFFR